MENAQKHRDIKIVTREKRRKYLVSEQNHHTTKFFAGNLFTREIRKLKY